MRSKIIYSLVALLFLLILSTYIVQAQDTSPRYNFRKATLVDLKDVCYNNNSYCTPQASCNISILFSNNTAWVQNSAMTNTSYPYFNYTLQDTQTQTLGIYQANVICLDQGGVGKDSFFFEISQTGTTPTVTQGIIYFIAVLLGILLFSLCLYGAITIPWKNNRDEENRIIKVNDLKYVKMFLWFGAYMLLIMITYLAYNITWGFLSFELAGNIFNAVYWILISALFPIIVVGLIMAVVNFVLDMNIKKDLERGFFPQ